MEKDTVSQIFFFFRFQNESTYVLKNSITTVKLINFIHNFTNNKLHRHLRHNSNLTHSHFYNDEKHYNMEYYHQEDAKKNETLNENSEKIRRNTNNGQIKFISIKEINAKNFEQHVLKSNKVCFYFFLEFLCVVIKHIIFFFRPWLCYFIQHNVHFVRYLVVQY